jgi:fibronectin-binding autotransporter adhesin
MKISIRLLTFVANLSVFALAASAQNATWTGSSSTAWNTNLNWNPNTSVPTGTATFNLTGIRAVNVDGATTIDRMAFASSGTWTFSGSALTIAGADTGSGTRPLSINDSVQITFQNEVIFGSSQSTAGNVGQLDIVAQANGAKVVFEQGIRGNAGIDPFVFRTVQRTTLGGAEVVIKNQIADIDQIIYSTSNSTLDLQASSSVSVSTTFAADNGVLKLGNNNALGTGSLILNQSSSGGAATTLQATGASRTFSNALTLNGGYSNSDVGIFKVLGDYDLKFTGSTTLSRHASIEVAANLSKSGAGTMVLSGTGINYSGSTTVSAGTLLINGTQSESTAHIYVTGTGVLGGTGSTNRNITFQSNGGSGGLNPGDVLVNNGIGTFTVTGGNKTVTLLSDTQLTFDIQSGVSHDQFVVNGNLILDGLLNINDLGVSQAGNFLLITYTGTFTNNGLLLGSTPLGWDAVINTSTSGQVWLQVNAIPEPSAAMLLSLGLGTLLCGCRRKRASHS